MKPDLIVLGHLMEEIIIFPDHIIGPMIGGVSAYFSVVASCLGSKVGIVSKIGKDMSKKLLDPICKAGVDIQGVRTEGVKSRMAELYYAEDGSKIMKHPHKGNPIVLEDIPINYFQADMIYIAPQDWEFDIKEIDKLSPLFKGKIRFIFLQNSFDCYLENKIKLKILKEGFKRARLEGINAEEVFKHMLLMKKISNKIQTENIRKDIDLQLLYGYSIIEKHPKKAELLLKECLKKKFEPLYVCIMHYITCL